MSYDPDRAAKKAAKLKLKLEAEQKHFDALRALEELDIAFQPWPKIPRLNRDITITEKIDGTNAAVGVSYDKAVVWAQSRTRIITPQNDNAGFAKWVEQNARELADVLGPGLHFGEWWGQGVQRGYGMTRKFFSL